MTVHTGRFQLRTKGGVEVHDITEAVAEIVGGSKIRDGIACVATAGSTAAIATIEHEPGLLKDLERMLESLAPRDAQYAHDQAWGDDNGHSHLRSTLLGTSLSLPVVDGRAQLGTWQQIVFIELDNRAREREVSVQVVGE